MGVSLEALFMSTHFHMHASEQKSLGGAVRDVRTVTVLAHLDSEPHWSQVILVMGLGKFYVEQSGVGFSGLLFSLLLFFKFNLGVVFMGHSSSIQG